MAARRAKGTNLLGVVKGIKNARKGGATVELTQQDEAFVSGRVIVTEWYPFELFERLLLAVHEQALGGSDDAAVSMGAIAAQDMLGGVHRAFVHEGNALKTVRSLEAVWPRYFDFGELRVMSGGTGTLVMQLLDYPNMSRCHGHMMLGWLRTCVALANGKIQSSEITCRPWHGAARYEAQVVVDDTQD